MSYEQWTNVNKVKKIGPKYYGVGDLGQIVVSDDRKSWSQCHTNSVSSLWALDGVPGFILAGGYGLMKSMDGVNFTQMTNLPKYLYGGTTLLTLTVYSIQVVNSLEAYVGCNYGIILHTVDGGQTWESIDMHSPATLCFAMFWRDSSVGWVGTIDGNIRKTTDGGHTWVGMSNAPTLPVRDIKISQNGIGYACGDSGLFLKSTDDGNTWSRLYFPALNSTAPDNFKEMVLFGDNEIFLVANDGIVIHTVDGGSTWENLSNMWSNWSSLAFESPSIGVIAGFTVTAATNDGGHTWVRTNSSMTLSVTVTTFSTMTSPPAVSTTVPTTTTTAKKKP